MQMPLVQWPLLKTSDLGVNTDPILDLCVSDFQCLTPPFQILREVHRNEGYFASSPENFCDLCSTDLTGDLALKNGGNFW